MTGNGDEEKRENSMKQIAGKKILITGGASGIGRLLALRAAGMGATVVVWDINDANRENIEREVRGRGQTIHTYNCDVSRSEEVYRIADKVREEVGPVDILVNNAGVVSGKPFLECTDDQLRRCMDVNLIAHFWTVRAFLPDMIRNNSGHIVTIASAAGIIGVSHMVDYCASKSAAFGFDEALRMEFRKKGWNIKTTVVCPYFIDTGMFKGVKSRFPFLLPILKEDTVAVRLLGAILNEKRRLIMPPLVYAVWLLRLLPVFIFDFVADFLGINAAMNKFVGRPKQEGEDKGARDKARMTID
jgi:all-trans-retinol dehydrogenase (NAD+)